MWIKVSCTSPHAARLLSPCTLDAECNSVTMLIHLLLLSLVSSVHPLIIDPRQNFNVSSSSPTAVDPTGAWRESASECIKSKHSWATISGTEFVSTTVYITSNTYEDQLTTFPNRDSDIRGTAVGCHLLRLPEGGSRGECRQPQRGRTRAGAKGEGPRPTPESDRSNRRRRSWRRMRSP